MGEARNKSVCSECQGSLHIREVHDTLIHDRNGNPKTIQKVTWRRCDCVEAAMEKERLGMFYSVTGTCPQAAKHLQKDNSWFVCPKVDIAKRIIRDRLLLDKRKYLYMSVADLSFDRTKTTPEDSISRSAGYYEYPQFFLTFGYDETTVREFMVQMAKEVISLRYSHGKSTWLFTPKNLKHLVKDFPVATVLRSLPFMEINQLS